MGTRLVRRTSGTREQKLGVQVKDRGSHSPGTDLKGGRQKEVSGVEVGWGAENTKEEQQESVGAL